MTATPPSVFALVPYAHVADVERSLAFYTLLGLARKSSHADAAGRTVWAMAEAAEARIMLALASGPIDSDQQAVLFYLYCADVAKLRCHLLAGGLRDGGAFGGHATPTDPRGVVFDLAFPFYMPAGQLRVHDPDGYVLLIGQLA